ncbi:MAG: hypothetical protein EA392_09800 [Cryomorphaceae bacterium]|nr:MAG: hypothetical protein EA392_09800 [Cryomorphaceae bacterium]
MLTCAVLDDENPPRKVFGALEQAGFAKIVLVSERTGMAFLPTAEEALWKPINYVLYKKFKGNVYGLRHTHPEDRPFAAFGTARLNAAYEELKPVIQETRDELARCQNNASFAPDRYAANVEHWGAAMQENLAAACDEVLEE